MKCPYCKVDVDENVDRCPNCGKTISKPHTLLGKISLVSMILTIVCIVSTIATAFSGFRGVTIFLLYTFSILAFILTITAIVSGAISYFGKAKDSYGLAGFVVGIILLLLGVPIAVAATTYVYVSGLMGETISTTPVIACTVDNDNDRLTVISSDLDVPWSEISIKTDNEMTQLSFNGGDFYTVGNNLVSVANLGATGYVTLGDYFTIKGVSGEVLITLGYNPRNTVIGMWTVDV